MTPSPLPRRNPPNRPPAWAAALASTALILAVAPAPGPAGHWPGLAVAQAQDASRSDAERAGDRAGGREEAPIRIEGTSRQIDTAFYELRLTTYKLRDSTGPINGTERPLHFSVLDDENFLLVTRLGNLFHLTLEPGGDRDGSLVARKLAAAFPIDHADFESFARKKKLEKYVEKQRFRINDLHLDVEADERVLYVSHQFFDAGKECFTLRISKLDGSVSGLLDDEPAAPPRWRTLYETAPCLPLQQAGDAYEGHQAGGRIVGLDGKFLLFTVGDHGFDGDRGEANYPQATGASYGKILKIDRETGRSETFSLGHRNPQGLYRGPGGAIYATEHGPRGGDEVNRIEEGGNYGWPHVIYGTAYHSKVWPLAGSSQNSHRGYEPPVFVWVPSIGISDLVGVEGGLLPLWRGNLLVTSLKAQAVFRLQMQDGRDRPSMSWTERIAQDVLRLRVHDPRVVYVEKIDLENRIRDIAQTPNGEIWLVADSRRMLRLRPERTKTLSPAMTARKRLYGALCAECHSMERNGPHGIGPNLYDLVGKRIARSEGYDYSPALRARSSERWTPENLLAFMADPEAFAPGTKMQFRVAGAKRRRMLLRYLTAR